jgi:glycine hydroxymethyltransferase
VAARLEELGIIVNTFNGLPGIPYPSFRLSLAEVTRMGAHEAEVQELAAIFAETVLNPSPSDSLRRRSAALCEHLRRPKYCFELEDLLADGLPADMTGLATAFYERVGARMV